jgi:hypothetical protein
VLGDRKEPRDIRIDIEEFRTEQAIVARIAEGPDRVRDERSGVNPNLSVQILDVGAAYYVRAVQADARARIVNTGQRIEWESGVYRDEAACQWPSN